MQKLAQVAPGSVWRHQTLAEAYESQGSYDAAISEYRQVLAADPAAAGHSLPARAHAAGTLAADQFAGDRWRGQRSSSRNWNSIPAMATPLTSWEKSIATRASSTRRRSSLSWRCSIIPTSKKPSLGLAAVLMSLQKPDLALPHLQKAVALNAGKRGRVVPAFASAGNAGARSRTEEGLCGISALAEPEIEPARSRKTNFLPGRSNPPATRPERAEDRSGGRHEPRRGRCPTRPAGQSPATVPKTRQHQDPGERCSPARTRASGPTWAVLTIAWFAAARSLCLPSQ